MTRRGGLALGAAIGGLLPSCAPGGDPAPGPAGSLPGDRAPAAEPPAALAASALDWRKQEAPLLTGHIQLTSREAFVKAGEAYFNADATWIIFQAVPVPAGGADPDPFYSMYVARLVRDAAGGIMGIETPILVSPPGSANTCGWFHPSNDGRVIFGSTIVRPMLDEKPGFKVGTNRYAWSFPDQTEIVTARGWMEGRPDGSAAAERLPIPEPVFTRPDYDAECSYSADGRFILYSHVGTRNPDGSADADIWMYDTGTGSHHAIVEAPGYDGGPFFSPDGRFITYRSDRKGDNLLQLFIGKLRFDAGGVPVGLEWERALTDNGHVNWCPYWHPSGRFLVYATSEVGHTNYEVFAISAERVTGADSWTAPDAPSARITFASGADVLPAFSDDGRWMMWTAQRGPMAEGESKPSSQIWAARVDAAHAEPRALFSTPEPSNSP